MSVTASYALSYSQESASDVVAANWSGLFTARVAGQIDAIKVACDTAPTGNYKITVDVKKCDGTSVLDSAVEYDSSESDCEVLDASIKTTALAEGDTIGVEVTVSGDTGNQGQGLIVTIYWSETT